MTVVTMLVCFFILHARLRAHRAPGIPCALFNEGRTIWQNSGALRREIVEVCLIYARRHSAHCNRIAGLIPPPLVGRVGRSEAEAGVGAM